ncbi:hypothetical protein [Soonwooa sp.]|uniref:hypothetical protein n=1 Tax=Soonwooa sp. TaxID=1938592 RepID=UPI00262A4EFA|nr:hypothetical protein [Soonwooa sp.]
MKYLVFILLSSCLFGQSDSLKREKHLVFEVSPSFDFSNRIVKNNVGVSVGFWYRYPIEYDARLELGGSIKYTQAKYNFVYGKNGVFYDVNSDIVDWNLGARMVKNFKIKNKNIEWISELTIDNMFFDGKNIPDTPRTKPDDPNTIVINVDVESIASFRLAQGFRFWIGDFGIMPQVSYSPYSFWYRNKIPNRFEKLSVDLIFSVKL